MEKKCFHSIQLKMIVIPILISTTLLVLFACYNYVDIKQQMTTELQEVADRTLEQISESLVIPLWDANMDLVEKILTSTMKLKPLKTFPKRTV